MAVCLCRRMSRKVSQKPDLDIEPNRSSLSWDKFWAGIVCAKKGVGIAESSLVKTGVIEFESR